MSGSMSEAARKQAMESLRTAAQRSIDCVTARESVLNENEGKRVDKAIRKARERLVECWKRFPECRGDAQAGKVPPAAEILAIIERQEAAIAFAESGFYANR